MISAHSVSLYKPIWRNQFGVHPNYLTLVLQNAPALLNMARTDPVWRWQAWKRRNPDWKGPQCVGSAQENGKWGIEASERLWTIFKNILLAWFDITTYPLVIMYLNIRKLVQWEWPLVIHQRDNVFHGDLPILCMYVQYVGTYVRTYGGNLIEVWELNMGIDINMNVTN